MRTCAIIHPLHLELETAPYKEGLTLIRYAWTIPLVVLLSSPVIASEFTGQVIGVIDGDTIEVLHNQKPQRIRLHGIDCPEKGQASGKVAKWATSALVFGRTVTVQGHDTDKYKRLVAEIILADGTNVNQKLVKNGWCWWYRKYALDDAVLEALEQEARMANRGLWVDPNPTPPWEWRKRSKTPKPQTQ